MEPRESFEDTGRREVEEEVGLLIEEMTLLSVFSGPECYFRYDHGDEVFNSPLMSWVTASSAATR